jgi:hypothetical protein
MMEEMFRTITGTAALLSISLAGLSIGCGTSSTGPDGGSKFQTANGISGSSGYPAQQPKDAGSPALASSSETQYSRDQVEKEKTSTPEGGSQPAPPAKK